MSNCRSSRSSPFTISRIVRTDTVSRPYWERYSSARRRTSSFLPRRTSDKMSVSRSALATGKSERISLPSGHCSFGDLLDHVRHVGKRANNGPRIVPPGSAGFRFCDVVDDALDELQAISDRERSDGCIDVVDVRIGHEC